MKKLAAVLVIVSATAQAATSSLSVSGTIATTCSFGSPTTGTFGYDPAAPTVLNTSANGGNPAQVSISFSGLPTITVSEVTGFSVAPNGYSGSPTFTNTLTHSGGSLTYSSGVASYTQTSGTTDTFTLNLRASNGSTAFPLGTYTASATITCN
jgi:hypothetical protein